MAFILKWFPDFLNLLWPSDAMWWHRCQSTLTQVMACCLTAPSHYLNQGWLIIREVLWHSQEGNFTGIAEDIYLWYAFDNYQFNTLRPIQNGCHFADDHFKCILLNETIWILINISLKFVPKSHIYNIPVLVQIMAWHRLGTSHYQNQLW